MSKLSKMSEIKNYKLQNTNYKQTTIPKLQIPNKAAPYGLIVYAFGAGLKETSLQPIRPDCAFGHCNLFVICSLYFVIFLGEGALSIFFFQDFPDNFRDFFFDDGFHYKLPDAQGFIVFFIDGFAEAGREDNRDIGPDAQEFTG